MAPWFPLFGRDFLAATTGWTAEERGHYITLLIVQWEQGALPDDVKRLELISPGIRSCWKAISDKFPVCSDGRRRNNRLEHERSKASDRTEKARQSASKLWAAKRQDEAPLPCPSYPNPQPAGCDGICDGICERSSDGICEGICSADASTTTYITTTTTGDRNAVPAGWQGLLEAWNQAADGRTRRAWLSAKPPAEAADRLAEPGWAEEAAKAIPLLAECRQFTSPVSLGQLCKPNFVAEVLGGYYRDSRRQRGQRPPPDDRTPPQVDPAFAAAARATMEREAKRREQEHRRLDALAQEATA